jgi:hypothetical protein
MTNEDQGRMLRAMNERMARGNETMLELLFGSNPITDDELQTLIAKRPNVYGRFAKYLGKRQGSIYTTRGEKSSMTNQEAVYTLKRIITMREIFVNGAIRKRGVPESERQVWLKDLARDVEALNIGIKAIEDKGT